MVLLFKWSGENRKKEKKEEMEKSSARRDFLRIIICWKYKLVKLMPIFFNIGYLKMECIWHLWFMTSLDVLCRIPVLCGCETQLNFKDSRKGKLTYPGELFTRIRVSDSCFHSISNVLFPNVSHRG